MVTSDAQIVRCPAGLLLSLAWKPIKHKHLDLFLKLWPCLHAKLMQQPLGGARPQQQQRVAGVAEVARASLRVASAAGVRMVVW